MTCAEHLPSMIFKDETSNGQLTATRPPYVNIIHPVWTSAAARQAPPKAVLNRLKKVACQAGFKAWYTLFRSSKEEGVPSEAGRFPNILLFLYPTFIISVLFKFYS